MSGALGGGSELTRVVEALQSVVQALNRSQQTLAKGINTNSALATYTVAGLPALPAAGVLAYASNGRNTGQGAGTGTGTVVVGNGSAWIAIWSGAVVTA